MTIRIFYLLLVGVIVLAGCAGNEQGTRSDVGRSMNSPAGNDSEEPNLVSGLDGKMYMSWIERTENQAFLKYATLTGDVWSKAEIISVGSDWFINWADYPSMAVNHSGDMIAHYLQMSDSGTYTYDIKVVAKKANTSAWSEPITLNTDGVKAEHGFVSILARKDGRFILSWLDGRNTVPSSNGHGQGSMTLRSAILDADLLVSGEMELDSRVCDCCQTSLAQTKEGPIVFYRDRSEQEIRDISFVRFTNGDWSRPSSVYNDNWMISGCPVNGPQSSAMENTVAVAWFSASGDSARVQVAFSDNSGQSFHQPLRLDEGNALGRVDIKLVDSETAIVSWMEGETIAAAKVNSEGVILKRYQLSKISSSRRSGFPQIGLHDGQLIFAWTDTESRQIAVGKVDM